MTGRPHVVRGLALGLVTVLVLGCEDSIIKMIGPANNETVTTIDGVFRYQSGDLDNVTDQRQFTWVNTSPRATVKHRSFVHHGSVLILVHDQAGTLVDSTFAEWELDAPTDTGVPGVWTVDFRYFGARGRVDTILEPLAAP